MSKAFSEKSISAYRKRIERHMDDAKGFLKRHLNALIKLKKAYEENRNNDTCPLCRSVWDTSSGESYPCDICVWSVGRRINANGSDYCHDVFDDKFASIREFRENTEARNETNTKRRFKYFDKQMAVLEALLEATDAKD